MFLSIKTCGLWSTWAAHSCGQWLPACGLWVHVELQDRISALKLPPLLWDLGQVTDSTTLRTMEGRSKKTIIFLLSFVTCLLAIPREEFYSFGQNSGDTTVPSNDDGSSEQITLQFGSFSYFEKQYTNLFVSYLCYQQRHHNANLFQVCKLSVNRSLCQLMQTELGVQRKETLVEYNCGAYKKVCF